MIKKVYLIFVLLPFVFINSCVKPSQSYLEKSKQGNEIIKQVEAMCTFNSLLDKSKDWNLATIYFPKNSSSLSTADKEILNKLENIYKKCAKNMLIIGHSSNLETKKDLTIALNLSYKRTQQVYNYLTSKKIPSSNLSVLFCSNNKNKVDEKTALDATFNQRVDIIILNSPKEQHLYDCL